MFELGLGIAHLILANNFSAADVCTLPDALKFLALHQVNANKKLSYRRGTARCVVSVEILPIATQQCRNYLNDKS